MGWGGKRAHPELLWECADIRVAVGCDLPKDTVDGAAEEGVGLDSHAHVQVSTARPEFP